MDFIIRYNAKFGQNIKIRFENDNLATCKDLNVLYIQQKQFLRYDRLLLSEKEVIKAGDVIDDKKCNNGSLDPDGVYYTFIVSAKNPEIEIISDTYNLLPIYFAKENDCIIVTSSFSLIAKALTVKSQDPYYYPQLVVFYAQLSGRTFYEQIKRLGYGESILLAGTDALIQTKKRFYDMFVSGPEPFNTAITKATDMFISESKKYYEGDDAISLTGGFDGRTNVACSKYYRNNFTTFSYGRIGYSDVDVPISIAQKLNISYFLIDLNLEYLNNEYFDCVQEYMALSGGQNGFSYPHSLYYAKKLSKNFNNIVTGYFGSELLRCARDPDPEGLSHSVLDFIVNGNERNNHAYSMTDMLMKLGLISKKSDIDVMMSELQNYFQTLPKGLTPNQMYTTFFFELVSPNVFGPWIYNGMQYSKIRNPFMDKKFFSYVASTHVSSFYHTFPEHNMIKRKQSTMLYGHIFEKTWPSLGRIPISKGYSPYDIISWGGAKVFYHKFLTKKKKEQHGLDKMLSVSGAKRYLSQMSMDEIDSMNIDIELLKSLLTGDAYTRDAAFWVLSKIEYTRMLSNQK